MEKQLEVGTRVAVFVDVNEDYKSGATGTITKKFSTGNDASYWVRFDDDGDDDYEAGPWNASELKAVE